MASVSLTESPHWKTQSASPGSMADYEERVLTLGRNMDAILLVVSTEHDLAEDDEEQTIRIISVRKATKYETDWYYFGRA